LGREILSIAGFFIDLPGGPGLINAFTSLLLFSMIEAC